MVRNITGGNKQKGKKRSTGNQKRIIEYADEINSLYALVISPLGDCKFLVHCNDNVDRIGVIRGSLYKNNFIVPGDVVLITLRDFEQVKPNSKERCDIVIKYQAGEIEQLKSKKVFYVNTNNLFNLIFDKSKFKSTGKGKGNENDQISFEVNIKPQRVLGELSQYESSSEDDEADEAVEKQRDLPILENESSDEEDVDELDEYGNIKNNVDQELSKSTDEEEDEEDSEEDSE